MRPFFSALKLMSLLAATCLLPSAALADPFTFTFTKIAVANTPTPDRRGTFRGFFDVAMDDGLIAIEAEVQSRNGLSSRSVYAHSGGELSVVAETGTIIPGTSARFANVGEMSVGGGAIAFLGEGVGSPQGIYAYRDGTIQTILDERSVRRLGGIPLKDTWLSALSFDGNQAAFWTGRGDGSMALAGLAVYKAQAGQRPQLLADRQTPSPNLFGESPGYPLYSNGSTSIEEGSVAFTGFTRFPYLYDMDLLVATEAGLHAAVDRNTPIPDGQGNFIGFKNATLDSGNLAFFGYGVEDQQGIYFQAGSEIRAIADTNTSVPGHEDASFGSFNAVALDQGNIAFSANWPDIERDQQGLFARFGSTLAKVVDTTAPLEAGGKPPQAVDFFSDGLSGRSIVFVARYEAYDFYAEQAVYRADLALTGDYDGNDRVDQADLDLVLRNWGQGAAVPPQGSMADLPDRLIDQTELDRVLLNWGNDLSVLLPSVRPGSAATTPEPKSCTLVLLVLGAAAANWWIATKRRKRVPAPVIVRVNKKGTFYFSWRAALAKMKGCRVPLVLLSGPCATTSSIGGMGGPRCFTRMRTTSRS